MFLFLEILETGNSSRIGEGGMVDRTKGDGFKVRQGG